VDEAGSLLADASSISDSSVIQRSINSKKKALPPPLDFDDIDISNDIDCDFSVVTDTNQNLSSDGSIPPSSLSLSLPLGAPIINRSTSVNNFGYRKSEFNLFGMNQDFE
jgi:hypothetical protein